MKERGFETVALTGGTGFLGGAVIDMLLREGVRVKALARSMSKLERWGDALTAVEGDLENLNALENLAQGADGFIHCAGLTMAKNDADYAMVNVEGARRCAAAAAGAGAKFLHVSSLSARMPALSPYAASKFESEAAVADASGDNPWVIVRAPAIYGPGDTATLPFFKLAQRGLAPEPAADPPPRASILFVDDVAGAIAAALAGAPPRRIYELGDDHPDGYSWRQIGETLGRALDKKPRHIRAPRPLLSTIAGVSIAAARLVGAQPTFRTGQINEFFHPDWVARENLLTEAVDWRPSTTLQEGFAKTAKWYQENNLL